MNPSNPEYRSRQTKRSNPPSGRIRTTVVAQSVLAQFQCKSDGSTSGDLTDYMRLGYLLANRKGEQGSPFVTMLQVTGSVDFSAPEPI